VIGDVFVDNETTRVTSLILRPTRQTSGYEIYLYEMKLKLFDSNSKYLSDCDFVSHDLFVLFQTTI
jgi:hypothetical protein